MTYEPPTATVVASERKGDVVITVLEFAQVPSPSIAPASLWLKWGTDEPETIIELHRVTKRRCKQLTFETYDSEAEPPAAGIVYTFVSWWGSSQLETAQSDSAKWDKREFEPRDAARFRTRDGVVMARKLEPDEASPEAEVVPGGWDHEHCRLCWERISQYEDDPHVGYTDGNDWICEACYERFVASGFGKRLGEAA